VSHVREATRRTGRSGQAVVEFALILPLFMLLVFGTLEFGRAYYDMHLITNAARGGARVGSLPGKVESDVTSAVNASMNSVGLPGTWSTAVVVKDTGGVVRTGGLAAAQEDDTVAVTVSYGFSFFSGHILPGVSGALTLKGRCVFRHE
jgi:Flp pilus assembly protein TadG